MIVTRLFMLLAYVAFLFGAAGAVVGTSFSNAASAQAPPRSQVTFAQVNRIFSRNCVVCHNSASATGAGNLNLEPDVSYAAIVGQRAFEVALPRVMPGNPDRSYLFAKITGTQTDHGGTGGQMPLGQGPLSPAKIELLRQWILDGARP